MTAAALPSLTPLQSKIPRGPATRGELQMTSFDTSLRNCARGFSAPLRWFFHAMRVRTSFSSASSTPYFLQYAGASNENIAGAVIDADVPSLGGPLPVSPENPESFNFSTPTAAT